MLSFYFVFTFTEKHYKEDEKAILSQAVPFKHHFLQSTGCLDHKA